MAPPPFDLNQNTEALTNEKESTQTADSNDETQTTQELDGSEHMEHSNDDESTIQSVLDKVLVDKDLTSKEKKFIVEETDRLFPEFKRYELQNLSDLSMKRREGRKKWVIDRIHQTAEEILSCGMIIPFVDSLQCRYKEVLFSPNRVPREKQDLISNRIKEYLNEGILTHIPRVKVKFVAGISLAPRKDHPSNDREVLDFSELNRFIKEQEYKLPSVDDLHVIVQRVSVASTIDIKSCFTQLPSFTQSLLLSHMARAILFVQQGTLWYFMCTGSVLDCDHICFA